MFAFEVYRLDRVNLRASLPSGCVWCNVEIGPLTRDAAFSVIRLGAADATQNSKSGAVSAACTALLEYCRADLCMERSTRLGFNIF